MTEACRSQVKLTARRVEVDCGDPLARRGGSGQRGDGCTPTAAPSMVCGQHQGLNGHPSPRIHHWHPRHRPRHLTSTMVGGHFRTRCASPLESSHMLSPLTSMLPLLCLPSLQPLLTSWSSASVLFPFTMLIFHSAVGLPALQVGCGFDTVARSASVYGLLFSFALGPRCMRFRCSPG